MNRFGGGSEDFRGFWKPIHEEPPGQESPGAQKTLRELEKLRQPAGSRPGRRKITGAPQIGPKTEKMSLQNETGSEQQHVGRSRCVKNFFANFIFLIRMTTLNLNDRACQSGTVLASFHSGQRLVLAGAPFQGKFKENQ